MKAFHKTRGFTLIELMVTVAIVAILASVAYPGYQSQMRKTRRADAAGALMGLANAMERYFTENNTYLGAAGTSGSPANTGAPRIFPSQAPLDGATKYYDLSISAATATTYTIQAAPIAGSAQAADPCGTLSLTNTGVRGPTTPAGCW